MNMIDYQVMRSMKLWKSRNYLGEKLYLCTQKRYGHISSPIALENRVYISIRI